MFKKNKKPESQQVVKSETTTMESAEMKENQQVTIDNVKYDMNDLTDLVKSQIASLRATDMEIARQQAVLAMLKTARLGYARAIQEGLPK